MIVTKVIQYNMFCLLRIYVELKCLRKVVQVATKTLKIKFIKCDRRLLRSCFIFGERNNVIFRVQAFCTFASLPLLESFACTQKTIIKKIFRKHLRFSTNLLFNEFKVHDIRQLYLKTLFLYIKDNNNYIFNSIEHSYPTQDQLLFRYVVNRSIMFKIL